MIRNSHIRLLLLLLPLAGCMEWESPATESLGGQLAGGGVFMLSEGNFQYSNASMAFYEPVSRRVERNVFQRANGMKLGDVAQSMVMHDGTAWVVVNNSHVVFAINPDTGREKGRITSLTSPRHMHFVSDTKAYVTQLWDNRIFIVNPETFCITGHITCPGMEMESGSTEQMAAWGDYVAVSCWSYQNRLLKIDTRTDEVVASLRVGIQPSGLVLDHQNKLWTLTDGGYEGSPYGSEAPALYCIDPESFTITQRWVFSAEASPTALTISAGADTLYWIDGGVWKMAVTDVRLPAEPFIAASSGSFCSLGIDPDSREVYVGDAIDNQQTGMVYRHAPDGRLLDSFYTGVIPGAFCWKKP